jgi:hypothetical protein
MNREDIRPGDCLKLSYNVLAGPAQGDYVTGIGYATLREGNVHINSAWKDGTVWDTTLEQIGDHVEFRILTEQKEPRVRNQPDFILSEWRLHPTRRKELELLDTSNWKKMIEYIFGGLEPGDIISNKDNDEIICLDTVESGNVRGYHLKGNNKWSTKKSIVFGLGIGYQKMVKDCMTC